MTETTLAKYKGTRARNYCTLPKIDVPVIEGRTCAAEDCDEEVAYIQGGWAPPRDGMPDVYREGGWVHVEPGPFDHKPKLKMKCEYCGVEEEGEGVVVFKQYAWYDAVECSRCGGVTGYGTGD